MCATAAFCIPATRWLYLPGVTVGDECPRTLAAVRGSTPEAISTSLWYVAARWSLVVRNRELAGEFPKRFGRAERGFDPAERALEDVAAIGKGPTGRETLLSLRRALPPQGLHRVRRKRDDANAIGFGRFLSDAGTGLRQRPADRQRCLLKIDVAKARRVRCPSTPRPMSMRTAQRPDLGR